MHVLQERLLSLIDEKNIGVFTLRKIANLIGETLPQKVKHHLLQLEQKGFIVIDKKNAIIKRTKVKSGESLVSLPIVGSANCGTAQIYADENIEGFLKISKNLIQFSKGLYVIVAEGNSLNRADIGGKNIESGDYVIVESKKTNNLDNQYVVCIIDGLANIKKYREDKKNSRIVLLSESTKEYSPIFIHENDDFRISGRVVDVVKKFE